MPGAELDLFDPTAIEDESSVPPGAFVARPRTTAQWTTRVLQLLEENHQLRVRLETEEAVAVALHGALDSVSQTHPETSATAGKHWCRTPWACSHTGCDAWRAAQRAALAGLDEEAAIRGQHAELLKTWDDRVRAEVAQQVQREARQRARQLAKDNA